MESYRRNRTPRLTAESRANYQAHIRRCATATTATTATATATATTTTTTTTAPPPPPIAVGTVRTLCSRSLIRTQGRDNTAIKFYNALKEFEATIDNPIKNFEDLMLSDIQNDVVVFILTTHAYRIINQGMIPHGWYKLNGWNQANPKALQVDSLMKMVEPLYSILKDCFPSHPFLTNHPMNPPAWWIGIKGNLTKGLTKQRQKGEDEDFDPKTASLYIVNRRHPMLVKHKLGHMHYLKDTDIYHIAKKLMSASLLQGCDNMLHRAQIVISAFAVSRGGEIKWSRFSFWSYDPRFEIVDIGWTEIKTGNFYSMPMINFSDPDFFEVDPLHAFASACMVNLNILNRYGNDNRDFVWQDLHDIADASVCGRFRSIIRACLPDDMPKEVKLRYMPKSWRRGGITRLAHQKDLPFINKVSLSGHKSGSHFETYVDATTIGVSLPAVMTLAEYENIHSIPIPPTFDSVTGINKISDAMKIRIVTRLLPTNLNDWQPLGRLFPVLETMAATIIMSYNKMKARYFCSNAIVYKLEELFINDPSLSLSLLRIMSLDIKTGFVNDNIPHKQIKGDDISKIIDVVNYGSASHAQMRNQLVSLVSLVENLNIKLDSIQEGCNSVQDNEQQPQYIPPSSRKRARHNHINNNNNNNTNNNDNDSNINDNDNDNDNDDDNDNDNNDNNDNDNNNNDNNNSNNINTSATKNSSLRRLFTNVLRNTPLTKQKMSGITLQQLVKQLYDNNLIKRHVSSDGTFMNNILDQSYLTTQEKGPYNCALETVFVSCNKIQLQQLRKVLDTPDISHVIKDIMNQTNTFLFNLETEAGLVKVSSRKKRQFQDKIGGFGKRALNWKKSKHYGPHLAASSWKEKHMWVCCVERNILMPSHDNREIRDVV